MCIKCVLSAILAGPQNLRKTTDTSRSIGIMSHLHAQDVGTMCRTMHLIGSPAAHLKPWVISSSCFSCWPHSDSSRGATISKPTQYLAIWD